MKITYLVKHLLITLLIVNGFITSAQNIRGGLILGVNAAQIDGDNYGGYNKPGLNAGVTAELPFSSVPLLLRMDLLFSQKGAAAAFLNGQAGNGVINAYSVNLNYIEVPITLDYIYKSKYGAGLGFSLGRLVGGSEVNNGYEYPIGIGNAASTSGLYSGNFQPWDVNFILDGLYLFGGNHWMGNLRWMYSMRFIAKNNESHFYNQGEFNNVLALRIIYVLGNPSQK